MSTIRAIELKRVAVGVTDIDFVWNHECNYVINRKRAGIDIFKSTLVSYYELLCFNRGFFWLQSSREAPGWLSMEQNFISELLDCVNYECEINVMEFSNESSLNPNDYPPRIFKVERVGRVAELVPTNKV